MVHDTKARHSVSKTHMLLLASITTSLTAAYLAHYLVPGQFRIMFSLPSSSSSWLVLTTLVSTFGFGLGYGSVEGESQDIDLGWYPPRNTSINDLETALRGTGVYGFIFNSSHTPDAVYGTYNWCNMPRVRKREYVKAKAGYKLRYVEVVSLFFFLSLSFLA